MSSWSVIRIQESCRHRFNENIISDRRLFEENKNYKLSVVWGKAGNFKSSTINIFTRGDLLETGINSEGITKGINICKKDNIIIADTEGTGTDNSSLNRHDIVSLFCVCHSFVIMSSIYARFPIQEINEMINEKLAVLQRIFKNNPTNLNKPLLLIICPVANPMKNDRIQGFRDDANRYLQSSLPSELRNYFSDVSIKVISPLPTQARDKIYENEKFSVNDVSDSMRQEVDEAFNLAFNHSTQGKPGSQFYLLNHYFNLAQNNQIIDPLIFDKVTEFTDIKLRSIASSAGTFNGDYDEYTKNLNKLKANTINEINALNLQSVYKDYYKNKFEEEFLKWKQNHADVFNENLLSCLETIYENERKSIIREIENRAKSLSYQGLVYMINDSKNKIEKVKIIDTANNKDKISRLANLKKSKINQLENYDFQDVYIRHRVAKKVEEDYFNEIKDRLNLVKIADRNDHLNKLKATLDERFEKAFRDFFTGIRQPYKDKSSIKNENLNLFYRESFEYYENRFKATHERCLSIIEEARRNMQATVNALIQRVGTYNPRIVDEFSNGARAIDSKFLTDITKPFYDLYANDFQNNVIYSQFSMISTNATRSCIFSSSYYQCPDCGNIWEKRIEVDINSYLGCGNFLCYGNTIGCKKSFRTEMKEGNANNKMARQLDINQLMSICNYEISTITNQTLNELNRNLSRRN